MDVEHQGARRDLTHPRERGEVKFEHVPLSSEQDTTIAVRPRGLGVYELSPNPFAAHSAEYAFAGRPIEPGQHEKNGGWSSVQRRLAAMPRDRLRGWACRTRTQKRRSKLSL